MTDEQKELLMIFQDLVNAWRESGILDTQKIMATSVLKLLAAQKAQTQDEERKRAAELFDEAYLFVEDGNHIVTIEFHNKILNPESND